MFTLDKLDSESRHAQGAWMHVTDPETGLPAYADKACEKPVRIKMLGWESEEGKKQGLVGRNKLLRESMKRGKKNGPAELTLENLKENAETDAKTLAAMTVEWEHFYTSDKKEIKFSKEDCENAMLRYASLRRQCLEFIQDDSNFFTKPSES